MQEKEYLDPHTKPISLQGNKKVEDYLAQPEIHRMKPKSEKKSKRKPKGREHREMPAVVEDDEEITGDVEDVLQKKRPSKLGSFFGRKDSGVDIHIQAG